MGNPKMSSDSSSSDEDEGDAERRAAIASIVATSSYTTTSTVTNGVVTTTLNSNHSTVDHKIKRNPQTLNYSQIRAQKILDSILEKTLEIVTKPAHVVDDKPAIEGGVRLFRHAPIGIVFDHRDEIQGPKKRPKILPGVEINKNSKKFRRQIQSIVVDGMDIISAAKDACEKSLVRLQDKEARAKARAKKEEERVAELKKIRGEKWLPSINPEKAS